MHESRPELVTHAHDEPRSFEDTLREVVRASPYVALSLIVHALVLGVLWLLPAPEVVVEHEPVVKTKIDPPDDPVVIPPPEPEEPLEVPDDVPDDPVVTEEPFESPDDELAADLVDPAPDTGRAEELAAGVLGIGAGTPGVGKLGGGRGGPIGDPPHDPIIDSVDHALHWLAAHQSRPAAGVGYWSGSAFDLECGKLGDDAVCDGLSNTTQHDVGLTGLALLAFLGAGHTDKRGEYRDTVRVALRWLLDGQDPDGCLAPRESQAHTYDHLIATLALTEAYALTERRALRGPTIRAHEYMYALRNPGAAWRYAQEHPEMVEHANDMSVTGWAILAMTLAKDVPDLPFEQDALEDALVFLEELTDETGRTGYVERGGPPARLREAANRWDPSRSASMTAVGVLCRIFADPRLERPGARQRVAQGVDIIRDHPLVWDEDDPAAIDFYYWYYATYALHQYSVDPDGRDAWRSWEEAMVDAVLGHQVAEGEARGSWPPQVDPWGSVGGRVYSTAILTLCIEVFYRYDTIMGR